MSSGPSRRAARVATAVFCLATLAGALACAPAGAPVDEPPEAALPERPNIVVIVADDMGYGEPGCYGGTTRTPNIDRLAAEGLRFTDFQVTAPACVPSRLALLTGRYQQRVADDWRVRDWIPKEDVGRVAAAMDTGLAVRLKAAGYATALIGKWGLGARPSLHPLNAGFDRFSGSLGGSVDYINHVSPNGKFDWWKDWTPDGEPGYVTHLITRHAARFIVNQAQQPFFLVVSHTAPHLPYQAPGDEPVHVLGEQRAFENRPVEEVAPTYRRMVEVLDAAVGDILDTLDALDLTERTLVVFLSDNGANKYGSNGALRGGKNDVASGGVQVPAIARWPGVIAPGRTAHDLVSSLDLAPTLLHAAHGAAPAGWAERSPFDGRDLLPLLRDGTGPGERDLFWEHRPEDGLVVRAVRRGSWKLIAAGDAVTLFDLARDPGESTDRSEDEPALTAELLAAHARWKTDLSR